MFVKPAPGLKVRDPISKRHLPASGQEVPMSAYWLRRLAEGDVLDVSQIPDSDSVSEFEEEQ